MSKPKQREIVVNMKKISVAVLAVYILLMVSFYFLAGDQLHYRESRGRIAMPEPESGTTELVRGTTVEQRFSAKIQRLEKISVLFGTYYRPNFGIVTIELWNMQTNTLLMSGQFDAATVQEGQPLTIEAADPVERAYEAPLLLRIYADSQPGSALTALLSLSHEKPEGQALFYNGTETEGTLCFAADGTDYIWTGLHYWALAAMGGLLLACFLGLEVFLQIKGKHSYLINALTAVQKYRFLIRQLVSRDFKTKYKRSVLGVFWSFLNPLLMMCVQYFVFSTIFQNDIPHFAVYLLIGIVMFNFFSEACGMSLTSVLGNASLITKVYMPKYIYPLTRVMSSVVNLLISLIPLILVCLFTGVRFHKSVILALYFLTCLIMFCLGLGLLLSASMVFFRDTQFLWGVLSMIWMYATPIFYPETILPEKFRFVLRVNPLYYFLKSARMCILDGVSPEPMVYVQCMLLALGMLLVGAWIFWKKQDKFVLYL